MNLLAALPFFHYLLGGLFLTLCILLMLVILIQKGRGGGLSGAFGGVGGHSAFGAKTGDVFTWITVGLSVGFLLLAVVLNFVYRPLPTGVAAQTPQIESPQPPAQPGAPPTTPAQPGAQPAAPAQPGATPEAPPPAPAPEAPTSETPAP